MSEVSIEVCHNVLDFFGARKKFTCVTCVDKSPFWTNWHMCHFLQIWHLGQKMPHRFRLRKDGQGVVDTPLDCFQAPEICGEVFPGHSSWTPPPFWFRKSITASWMNVAECMVQGWKNPCRSCTGLWTLGIKSLKLSSILIWNLNFLSANFASRVSWTNQVASMQNLSMT